MNWFPSIRASFRLLAASLAAGAALAGCNGKLNTKPSQNAYRVTRDHSEFYKLGPAQAFGPDFQLKQNDRVTLLQRQFGYSHIQLADGTSGYVATEDIAVAPPLPPVRPTAALAGSTTACRSVPATGARRTSNVPSTAGDPLFDINDLPAPLPSHDPEPPKAKPGFRF